ncbi:hypothetical protein OCH239_05215 [Roseivivax halodurans JCM 10272]|uniref:Uncharacterized protein n=1 Tax=Roseivivax halodurans JCM 10272 TaxID=1449350 RepID=X7EDU2_9RHOB|nr:hypothetical protein [Roseivivax halodurans]ETX14040.1 hypothetical protein OCH239_05215 [Roseivivax halodurans JCM 10272]
MFDIKTLKSDAALVASAPRSTLASPVLLEAVTHLLDVPGPNRSACMARRLRQTEFEEFQSLCRALLGSPAKNDCDLLRLQLYADIVHEALDDQSRSYSASLAAE